MRWRTYNRHVERYDAYEDILDRGICALAAKLGDGAFKTQARLPSDTRKRKLFENNGRLEVSQEISIPVMATRPASEPGSQS